MLNCEQLSLTTVVPLQYTKMGVSVGPFLFIMQETAIVIIVYSLTLSNAMFLDLHVKWGPNFTFVCDIDVQQCVLFYFS